MARKRLSKSARERIFANTRKGELQPTRLKGVSSPTARPDVVARFKLLAPLEAGKYCLARRMQLIATATAGEFEWIPTAQEEPVLAPGSGWQNYWAAGAEVTTIFTDGGWMVCSDELCGVVPEDWGIGPYRTFRLQRLETESGGDYFRGNSTPRLESPAYLLDADNPPWKEIYVTTTRMTPVAAKEDLPVSSSPSSREVVYRTVPCTPLLGQPVRVAYKQFDNKLLDGTEIPSVFSGSMTNNPDPLVGELWAPGNDGLFHRGINLVEIWWWQICQPEWVQADINGTCYWTPEDGCTGLPADYSGFPTLSTGQFIVQYTDMACFCPRLADCYADLRARGLLDINFDLDNFLTVCLSMPQPSLADTIAMLNAHPGWSVVGTFPINGAAIPPCNAQNVPGPSSSGCMIGIIVETTGAYTPPFVPCTEPKPIRYKTYVRAPLNGWDWALYGHIFHPNGLWPSGFFNFYDESWNYFWQYSGSLGAAFPWMPLSGGPGSWSTWSWRPNVSDCHVNPVALYGALSWLGGYKVLGVDSESQTMTIAGGYEFTNAALLINFETANIDLTNLPCAGTAAAYGYGQY